MNRIIFGYQFRVERTFVLDVPAGGIILSVNQILNAEQQRIHTMWIQCHPNAPLQRRTFEVWVAGETMPDTPPEWFRTFVETIVDAEQQLVFHIFERADTARGRVPH